jgi:hypothetical protein
LRDTGTQALLLDFNDDENIDPVDLACLQECRDSTLSVFAAQHASGPLKNLAATPVFGSSICLLHRESR